MSNGCKIFYRGLVVSLTIGGNSYQGIVTEYDAGEKIIVKVSKVDSSLIQVMPNIECMVKCIAEDGKAYGFKTRLKDRKIPCITLSYPKEKLNGVNIRKDERVPTSFWAELKLEDNSGSEDDSRLKSFGDANIVDISVGGCKIMTQQKLKKGDSIWVEFSFGENDEKIRFKAIVRKSRPAPYESTYFGLQFDTMEADIVEKIEEIAINPQG